MKPDPQFEMIRQLPSELSTEDVQQLIYGFSALSWWAIAKSFFHLNTNVMIFTSSITIAGLIGFSVFHSDGEASPQGMYLPEAMAAPSTELPALSSNEIPLEATIEEPAFTKPSTVVLPSTALDLPPASDLSPIPLWTETQEGTGEGDSLVQPNLWPEGGITQSSESWPWTTSPKDSCETPGLFPTDMLQLEQDPVAIDHKDLMDLRRYLLNKLTADATIESKRSTVFMVYQAEEIWVNGKPLDATREQKYRDLLLRFGVEPGPHRRVFLHSGPKQTIVGDFLTEGTTGFAGSASGHRMDFDLILKTYETPLQDK